MPQDKRSKLLQHLKWDICVRVGKSEVHGIGLFAIRDIPKGANPFKSLLKKDFVKMNLSELSALPAEVKKMVLDYCAQENGIVYIPSIGFNPIYLLNFINHSSTPNVKPIGDGTAFIAIRRIKKGEELFSDYSTYDENFMDKM